MISEWRVLFGNAHTHMGIAHNILNANIEEYENEMKTEDEGDYKKLMQAEISLSRDSLKNIEIAMELIHEAMK